MGQRYELVLRKGGVDLSAHPVPDDGLLVGRASGCDIVLPDWQASRRHARFWMHEGELWVEDMKSRNGVFVNGAPVSACRLQEDDEVTVGVHVFVVTRHASRDLIALTGTMISYEKAGLIYDDMVQGGRMARLPILYKAAQLMGTVFDQDELLGQVLALVFEAFPAQRGFVLTLSAETARPEVRASLPAGTASGDLPLSMTLIRHVIRERDAVLTRNAQEDKRFDMSESVVDHHILAAMCVPLCGREAVIGTIYIDSGKEPITFTEEDLELFMAIGRVVGVAIENAHLHQEKLRNERLAAIGQATAGIGHCVKNMLTGMKGGGEFIEMGMSRSDWSWVERGWPIVRRSMGRVEELVLNLLSFSRDVHPMPERSTLEHIVLEVLSLVQARADKYRIELKFERGEAGPVWVDIREIFRVVLNLVTNALDACEDNGGVVTVTTSRGPAGCAISVSDTGPGISQEVRDRMFHAFVTTKGSRGTGLGLACSERIVKAHGGEIKVESEPGKGACFTVLLPRKVIDNPPREQEPTMAMDPNIKQEDNV